VPLPSGIEDLVPKIPTTGLVETTRSWSSAGELFEALAAVEEPEREWSARDLERRAHRVLAQRLRPDLMKWPQGFSDWLDALPAESLRPREMISAPSSGTSWRETARHGWPPIAFHGRTRHRIADTLLISTLRWTLESLKPVVEDARSVLPGLLVDVDEQLAAAFGLLEVDPVSRAHAVPPSFSDLAAVSGEGHPWNVLSPVAADLLRRQSDGILELIDTLIVPDDQLSGRLFHLGVLGELLVALRSAGADVIPVRPVSGSASVGPSYRVVSAEENPWELWFEAAGLWSERQILSPYQLASQGVPGAGGALGADLLLAREDARALLVECKYSANPARVARDGFHQAAAYALEARELFEGVVSVVVGPSDVVIDSTLVATKTAKLGICRPDHMDQLLLSAGFV
jgi:hypothetical protein